MAQSGIKRSDVAKKLGFEEDHFNDYKKQELNANNFMFSTQKLSELSSDRLGNVPNSPNSNRLVDIKLRPLNSVDTNTNESWRYNLSRIYSQILGNSDVYPKGAIQSNNLKEAFDVKESVVLSLERFPKIKTSNEWTKASEQVSETVDAMQRFIKDIKGTSQGNNNSQKEDKTLLGTLKKYTAQGTSMLTTAIGFFDSLADNKGNDYAAPGRVLQPWSLNVPVWKGTTTENLTFDLNFKFNMGQYGLWNAYEEVYKPAINLLAPVMMRNNGHLFADGPGPNVFTLLAHALGNLTDGEKEVYDETDFFNKIEKCVIQQYTGYVYEVSLGSFVNFTNVIFTDGEVSWGTEVDNYGYPTSASVTLNLRTMTPMALNNSSSLALAVRYGGMNS